MHALRVSLAVAILFSGGIVAGHASVRSFDHLTLNEKMALEESERRVAVYDHELLTLDHDRARHKIMTDDYRWRSEQLTTILREESLFQNAILVRSSDLPERARDLLETLQHAALAVPVGIGYVVGICPQFFLGLLASVH
jgi:hypothetical protein